VEDNWLESVTAEGLIGLGHTLEPTRVLGTVNAVPVQPKSAFQAVAEPTRYQGGSAMTVH